MSNRPYVQDTKVYGGTLDVEGAAGFWVEYPDGLIDLTRSHWVHSEPKENGANGNTIAGGPPPPLDVQTQTEIEVQGDPKRRIRVSNDKSALVVIDMQNFFLHPDLRNHPKGLACVQPLMDVIPKMRDQGMKILWVNWGLTDFELKTLPPALIRSFQKNGGGGFGSELPGDYGRLLMRDAHNSDLYGPLQAEYEKGKAKGTDVWIHKNRMSGLWGYQTALDLYLKENGIRTLFFTGVNTDQVGIDNGVKKIYDFSLPKQEFCVSGTMVDAYYRGYDCILLQDATATPSPGGFENITHNAANAYGFVTDTKKIISST